MADYDVWVEHTAGGDAGKWVRVTQCTYPEDARYQAQMMTGGKASTAYIVRNKGVQSSSSSDGDGGGCLLLLLLFGGAALVKFLPYILAAAAIGGGLWLVLSALSSASKDNDEITDYLKNR